MKRDFRQIDDLALTASVATTPGIDMRKWAGGNIVIPAGSSLTTLTFYASVDGGEFVPLYDSDGVAVTLTVSASKAYPLPDACFGVSDLKITGNTAGNIDIHLKG